MFEFACLLCAATAIAAAIGMTAAWRAARVWEARFKRLAEDEADEPQSIFVRALAAAHSRAAAHPPADGSRGQTAQVEHAHV